MNAHAYDPTSPEAIKALVDFLNAAVRALNDKEVKENKPPILSPEGLLQGLLQGLPQGSLSAARYDPETGLFAFTIKDRKERFIESEGLLALRALTLFNGGAYLDKNQKGGDEYHYLEVFSGPGLGITFQRLLADAQKGELVKMRGDHHLLTAANLTIARGPERNTRGRREALEAALADYDEQASSRDLTGVLSRSDYQAVLRGAFRLYDLKHGHNYLRVIGA
jgi:hypothetical protein